MGKLNLAVTIETRDGLLLKDPLLTNTFIVEGMVLNRPAVNTVLATHAGQAQGGVRIGVVAYFFNADVLNTL